MTGWIWLIIGLYCLPGALLALAAMRMACNTTWDRLALYEEGERPSAPRRWYRALVWPFVFLLVLSIWPVLLVRELKP